MIKFICTYAFLAMIILVPLNGYAEEAVVDKLMGTVPIKPGFKLDTKARREIAAAAARIKRLGAGTVKLRGSYPPASTEDDYISRSVFIAREVEQYMKTLLPARLKIYTLFSPYSVDKKIGDAKVEIFFYPRELKAADFEGFRVNAAEEGKPVVRQISGGQAETQVETQVPAVEQAPVKTHDDGKTVQIPAARPVQPAEDARRAEELVRRAKARAAKRAKQKDAAE